MEAAASHGYAKRIRTATVASHGVAGILGFPQRRALRAAIATTICFYLGWIVIDDPVLAVFATLGVIGLLCWPSSAAICVTRHDYVPTVIGAVLVALGTAVSEHTVAAAALLFVVALCVSLSTAMGRNVATGANGVLLFFLVACAVPAPIGALESRVPACCSAAQQRWWRP